MRIDVHVHHHSPELNMLIEEIEAMSGEVQRLQGEVADLTTVVGSAVALIAGLAQTIRDNATDTAALNDIADQLDTSKDALAAAVAANTPAAAEAPADTGGASDTGSGEAQTTDEGGASEGEAPTG